jgi:hypothetical protein
VDKSEFFKWIKRFAYWLFSAQFFACRGGARLQSFQQPVRKAALRCSVRNDLA